MAGDHRGGWHQNREAGAQIAQLWRIDFEMADSDQARVVESLWRGDDDAWVKGSVGTGKTQVLYWFAKRLINNPPNGTVPSICFVLFTRSLVGLLDFCCDGFKRRLTTKTMAAFSREPRFKKYDVIIVDEVQDLKPTDLQLLKDRCNHRLIVAGDPAQSLYPNRVSEAEIEEAVNGNIHTLPIPHRLSKPIAEVAQAFFPGAGVIPPLEDPPDGAGIENLEFNCLDDEVRRVWGAARTLVSSWHAPSWEEGEHQGGVAILLPDRNAVVRFSQILLRSACGVSWQPKLDQHEKINYRELNSVFYSHGLDVQYFGNQYGSIERAARLDWINLMTYYSAKGLDFRAVFLPCLTNTVHLFTNGKSAKPVFFVAMTRARNNLVTSFSGDPHPLLKELHSITGGPSESPDGSMPF